MASASIIEVTTVFGLQDCLLNVWWQSGGDAQIRVADASTGSAEKFGDSSTGAPFKSQHNLDTYACRRPISVVDSWGEIQLVR